MATICRHGDNLLKAALVNVRSAS